MVQNKENQLQKHAFRQPYEKRDLEKVTMLCEKSLLLSEKL